MKRRLFLALCAACAALAASGAKETPSRLDVAVRPEGAQVSVDGQVRGAAPCSVFDLAAGEHWIHVEAPSYAPADAFVALAAGDYVQKSFTLAEEKGLILVKTEPAGATVFVNGVERGVTPVTLAHVPKGVATVVFRLAGYRDETRELRLAPGDTPTLAVRLKGLPAKLTVVSTPERAKVFVDDAYQGKTPTTVSALSAGVHAVRIELAGHAPVTREVRLENGAAKTEEFRLESVLGRLEVATTPPGAKISVDGKAVGTTRSLGGDATRSQILALEGLAAGEHAVHVRLDGYQDASRRVVVKAKETGRLFVRLVRVFQADTEVETIRGVHRGVLVEKDFLGNITLEVSPGVQQTFRKEEIRKVTSLAR